MTAVTTRAQQAKIAAAARKVGGYRVLIALDAEKRAGSGSATIAKDARTGIWRVVDKPSGPKKKMSYKFALGTRAKSQRK